MTAPLQFASVYASACDLFDTKGAGGPSCIAGHLTPTAEDGWRGIRSVELCVESAREQGRWIPWSD